MIEARKGDEGRLAGIVAVNDIEGSRRLARIRDVPTQTTSKIGMPKAKPGPASKTFFQTLPCSSASGWSLPASDPPSLLASSLEELNALDAWLLLFFLSWIKISNFPDLTM